MASFNEMRSLAEAEARQQNFDPLVFEDELIEDAKSRGMINLACRHSDSICVGLYFAQSGKGQYIPGTLVLSAHRYHGEHWLEFAIDDPAKAKYAFERPMAYARDRGYDTSGFFNKGVGAGVLDLQDEQL